MRNNEMTDVNEIMDRLLIRYASIDLQASETVKRLCRCGSGQEGGVLDAIDTLVDQLQLTLSSAGLAAIWKFGDDYHQCFTVYGDPRCFVVSGEIQPSDHLGAHRCHLNVFIES